MKPMEVLCGIVWPVLSFTPSRAVTMRVTDAAGSYISFNRVHIRATAEE
jgi:hypothetical protein